MHRKSTSVEASAIQRQDLPGNQHHIHSALESRRTSRGSTASRFCAAQPPLFACVPILALFSLLLTVLNLLGSLEPIPPHATENSVLVPDPGERARGFEEPEEKLLAKGTFRLVAVGDILLLTRYMREAEEFGNFSHIWEPVLPLLRAADIACGNFEGVSSNVSAWTRGRNRGRKLAQQQQRRNGPVVTHDKVLGFNYPKNFVQDLADVGFRVLSVANNHCMDRGIDGLRQTVYALGEVGLIASGGRTEAKDPDDMSGFVDIVKVKGWNVAWLSCTTFANAIMQKRFQTSWDEVTRYVLDCEKTIPMIAKVQSRDDVDVVIVKVHHGPEWNPKHAAGMANRSIAMLEAGATVVLSGHSHVVQDATYYETQDGRQTYISYSLGSFSAGMGFTPSNRIINFASRASAMLYITIGEGFDKNGNRRARVEDVSYLPTCEFYKPLSGVRVYPTAALEGKCLKEERIVAKALGGVKRFVTPDQVLSEAGLKP